MFHFACIYNFGCILQNIDENITNNSCMLNRSDVGGWSVEGVETERVEVTGGSVTVQCSSSHLTAFACLVNAEGYMVGAVNPSLYIVLFLLHLTNSIKNVFFLSL